MQTSLVTKQKMKFYLWVGLAYCAIRIIGGLMVYPERTNEIIINNAWLTSYIIIVNYFLFEFSLGFFSLRKLHWFLLLMVVHIVLYPFVFFIWRELGLMIGVYSELAEMTFWKRLETLMSYAVGSIFFFGLCKHIYGYINLKRMALQLRIEKQEAELNFLKSQTNPHFLFNTLNNIYSLARDQSDLAPESIMRLSKILRYMLYETGSSFVSIEQELQIIQNYIELEKIRYHELKIDFQKSIDDKDQQISPLLLIPLIENAFKHGVSETISLPFVFIYLSVTKQQLLLKVENSIGEVSSRELTENIGLNNLRRQLDLLYKNYNLDVSKTINSFEATLKIDLASHVKD